MQLTRFSDLGLRVLMDLSVLAPDAVTTIAEVTERFQVPHNHLSKVVQFMAPTVCVCSTMARIDPQHLAWTLENLVDGKVVNRISVPEREAQSARVALKRMLEVV